MNQTTITSASLHFREGSSDKVYHAAVEAQGDGYIVTFSYGRRGSTLTTGTKTNSPVSLADARKVFDKLVASKVAKGYKHDGDQVVPYSQSGREGEDTGIRCQLLNPIEGSKVRRLLNDTRHCMQEKHDGRRLMVRKAGDEVIGINRRGLVVAAPEPIRVAAVQLEGDFLIDGEAVGEVLHAFDLLELGGTDLRDDSYLNRYACLRTLLEFPPHALRPVGFIVEPADKRRMFKFFRFNGSEGVVFKDLRAPFSPGRPNSGGTQLKFKFVESASFVVTAINEKRSVALGVYDGTRLVPAGNVSIPPNHEVPAVGDTIDARFLYVFPESGCIYQPVYLGKRDDIPADECMVSQLKYKTAPDAA